MSGVCSVTLSQLPCAACMGREETWTIVTDYTPEHSNLYIIIFTEFEEVDVCFSECVYIHPPMFVDLHSSIVS